MGIYLQIDGIEGNATHADHKNWIDISSLDFNVSRPGIMARLGAGDNREGVQPNISDVHLSKRYDKSSINLKKAVLSCDKAKDAEIHFVTTGNPGATYLTIKLKKALISGYSMRSGSDYMPEESFTLNFTHIQWKFVDHDDSNSPKSPVITGYDISTCKVD